MGSCTIVKTNKGRFVEETLPFVENILKYMHSNLDITFKEFTADFIRDENGTWWFINVKSFLLDKYKEPINVKGITMFGDYEVMQALES